MLLLMTLLIQVATATTPLRCSSLFAKSPPQDIHFFQSLLSHRGDLGTLPPQQMLAMFEAFARGNLVPSASYTRALSEAMRNSLYEWREADILSFASLRKLTPLKLDPSFLSAWRTLTLLNFEDWQIKTQLEVLGSELYQSSSYNTHEWESFFSQTTRSLAHSKKLQSPKSLKELYRGLMFLDGQKNPINADVVAQLIEQIQNHLQKHDLSLAESGRSGSPSPERNIGWPIGRLQILMDHEFPRSVGKTEYSDPSRPGFFDPVDLYYADLRLVIEWDGGHHYFRSLLDSGELSTSSQLRPLDVAKDATLRRQGYLVLRLSSQESTLLETYSLRELIEQQNPGAELPSEQLPHFYLNVRDSENSDQ